MNKIRELRKEKGLTLKELSNDLKQNGILEIAPDTLGKYERGDREPKLETWNKLAVFFNVSIPYLQGIDEETYNLKFATKKEAIDFIHKIMKAQNIKLEDIQNE